MGRLSHNVRYYIEHIANKKVQYPCSNCSKLVRVSVSF
jgi:hypothetical protein